MAEQLISPGVFTQENDQTFLPQGVGNIGAALIGPTLKGQSMAPIVVQSEQEFVQTFGSTNPNYYLPYTAKEYFRAGGNNLTVIRTLFEGGYSMLHPVAIVATGSFGKKHIAFLHPSQVVSDNADFYDSTLPLFNSSSFIVNSSGSLTFKVSGSFTVDSSAFPAALTTSTAIYTSSIDVTSTNYLGKILGKNPNDNQDPAYLYTMFDLSASASLAADANTTFYFESGSFNMLNDYTNAATPWIFSQTISGQNRNLFKFWTISDGTNSNYEIKVGISNIRPAGSVPGSEYGSFSIVVRAVDQSKLIPFGSPYTYQDSDTKPTILEQYDNVNLDPNSSRFIGRVIGDKYNTYINGKVVVNGNYSNKSRYIYVEVDSAVTNQVYSPELVPFGHAALTNPLPNNFTSIAPATYATNQLLNGSYNKKKWFGLDFLNYDNLNYLKPLPSSNQTSGTNSRFLLSNCLQHASAPGGYGYVGLTSATALESRKFLVPFQGGFDGIHPNKRKLVGTEIVAGNVQGYDLTDNTTSGYSIYKKAIDIFSNPDEIDINMLYMPGTIYSLHSAIVDYAATMCEDRGDVFYIFDCVPQTDSISNAISSVETIDNNYSATYYPWVKVMDSNLNKPLWVPPGVIMPGVLANNDKVGEAWFAPAGLNRGALNQVLDAYTRLTVPERNDLYSGRINPIATFAKDGVVVWGQKTLQARPSALDRINVRRLLITVKKFIASATRYLVFEQNTTVTRNKFINLCNPYLEMVQSKQGLYLFRVVMNETTNTADLIDRNIMAGYIELQPTKTAEIIKIDFNLLPTGAAFTA